MVLRVFRTSTTDNICAGEPWTNPYNLNKQHYTGTMAAASTQPYFNQQQQQNRPGGTANYFRRYGPGGTPGGGGGNPMQGGGGAGSPYGNPQQDRREFVEGKRVRKAIQRRTVDFNAFVIRHLQTRPSQRNWKHHLALQPDPNFIIDWTPDGRRLITGASSGEFTLWNGLTFNFETILQAHDKAVRTMVWSHNDTWLITGDDSGIIKYWQSNMNNLKVVVAHKETVRDLTFSPTDGKYASCSDDGTIKIWNFADGVEERTLTGHGWDVKCIDWHPSKGLLASGSKDNLVKLWDPKTGKALSTLHGHKNTILGIEWNKNGNWLVTASRDQLLRVYDIRTMRELQPFKGHKKDVQSVAWHPQHETEFVSGGSDGSMMFWNVGTEHSVGGMEGAHESSIFALDWHPMGHILVSGSNDHTTRFWTRNRPGDAMSDRFAFTRQHPDAFGGMQDEDDDGMDNEPTETTVAPPFSTQDFGGALPGLGEGAAATAAMPGMGGWDRPREDGGERRREGGSSGSGGHQEYGQHQQQRPQQDNRGHQQQQYQYQQGSRMGSRPPPHHQQQQYHSQHQQQRPQRGYNQDGYRNDGAQRRPPPPQQQQYQQQRPGSQQQGWQQQSGPPPPSHATPPYPPQQYLQHHQQPPQQPQQQQQDQQGHQILTQLAAQGFRLNAGLVSALTQGGPPQTPPGSGGQGQ